MDTSANDFCNWLQGFLDLSEAKTLNTKQVEMLKEKLATVNGHARPNNKTLSEPVPYVVHQWLPPGMNFDKTVGKGDVSQSQTVSTVLYSNQKAYGNW